MTALLASNIYRAVALHLCVLISNKQALGKLALPQSLALFAAATYIAVRKILFDHQEPYGSRQVRRLLG